MFWKRSKCGTSETEFLAIVKEMAALDDDYPELGTPSRIRQMISNGNFSIGKRPWDFIIALGYAMISLDRESGHESGQAVSLLRDRMEKALKYPAGWMIDAITPEVEARYLKASGENLPQAALLNQRVPRNLRGKTFSWIRYAQLQYVLRRFCRCPYAVDLPISAGEYWGVLSVREMRDFVASMECPPEEILQELNREAAIIELKALNEDLSRALKRAQSLKELEYKTAYGSVELRRLEEIVQTLGVKAKFAEGGQEDSSKTEAAAEAAKELMTSSI